MTAECLQLFVFATLVGISNIWVKGAFEAAHDQNILGNVDVCGRTS